MGRNAATIEDRLRAALNVRLEEFRDGVDMSAETITARLRDACDMSSLALALVEAGTAVGLDAARMPMSPVRAR